jgi:periplasmic copper chaperone A
MRPRTVARAVASALALALSLAACGSGGSSAAAGPSVTDAWARPAAANGQSAAYLTITNPSGSDDTLIAATSPAAGMVGLHETATDATGLTSMHALVQCAIPARGSVRLAPGGMHIMLMDLRRDLIVGSSIELDLVFEHAGTIVVKADIRQG